MGPDGPGTRVMPGQVLVVGAELEPRPPRTSSHRGVGTRWVATIRLDRHRTFHRSRYCDERSATNVHTIRVRHPGPRKKKTQNPRENHPYFTEQGGFGVNEYGRAEQHMGAIAAEMTLPTGTAQAGRWFGGGELTEPAWRFARPARTASCLHAPRPRPAHRPHVSPQLYDEIDPAGRGPTALAN
jgi:hypothetical protein